MINNNISFINNLIMINKMRLFYSGGWSLCYTDVNHINHYNYNTIHPGKIEIDYADRPLIGKKDIIVGLYPKDEIETDKRVFINYCVKKKYFNPKYKSINYWENQDKIISYMMALY